MSTVRRYFALTNYAGGVLPAQYDPRNLILRRAISPITGTTDIQATMETLHLGIHQRLQTKRGPEGKRRIIDYMTLDLDTTYFPYASRDNFGKPFGQNMYNWQWFIGDRTSIVSYGWFEFWNIGGNPIYNTNIDRQNDPFGLNMITSGITHQPAAARQYLHRLHDRRHRPDQHVGPHDDRQLLAEPEVVRHVFHDVRLRQRHPARRVVLADADRRRLLDVRRADVDPQRQSYSFRVLISPRLSPNIKLGNGVGMGQFDARYAPTQ